MSESAIAPVVVGLAIGIGFIVLFATIFAPTAPEESGVISTTISDFIVETHYRFSKASARMLDFEVDLDAHSIRMVVDIPSDTELTVRFHDALLHSVEGIDRSVIYPYENLFTIFVDGVPIDATTWEYTELESIVTIPLEAGSGTIEIVPSSLTT
ncbi:MAG: hypothetical protein HRF40_02490 [Nitrososphaera sp.]